MMRSSPLNACRATSRRNEGRVTHNRIKPKAKAAPDKAEREHLSRVAALGCLVCRRSATIHHVMRATGKIRRRDHRFVAPLCPSHHQGDEGVHGLGSETAFQGLYGIDLAAWAVEAWDQRDNPAAVIWQGLPE